MNLLKVLALVVALLVATTTTASAAQADVIEREIAGAFQRSEWTRQEKLAFTVSTVAHLADLGTSLASDERCVERNALLGSNPSNGTLIGVKLVAIGFEYWLYSSPRFHGSTHWYGYTSAVIHGLAAYTNSKNDCYD